MEKKILEVQEVNSEFETVIFQKQVITVKKRLGLEDIIQLATTYLQEYYAVAEDRSQVIYAEYAFQSTVFDLATDFSIKPEDFGKIASTSLYEDVLSKIENIKFARDIIEKSIQKIDKENSIENKIAQISNKLIEVMDNLSANGFNEDMLKSIQNTVKDIGNLGIKEEMPVKVRKTKKAEK